MCLVFPIDGSHISRVQPGYRVYRHLQCAVFSEEIQSAEDIGGWKNLTSDDYEKLVARVEQSKIELENENEELQPDELVPVSFQGEMRKAPLGLVGSLLPFQTEGVSWMHHQEVSENIRGGILADEMVGAPRICQVTAFHFYLTDFSSLHSGDG